ncbi:hypothetical protein Tco_1341402 [Tanacetum coccineum]
MHCTDPGDGGSVGRTSCSPGTEFEIQMSIFSSCYLFRNLFSSTTMGDENHIRTLGDYSKPSHEGYKNTIELPVGNNVAPLRSDTIRLVQKECSFHGLRSEDPNQHLKDFLKLVDSLNLDGENREFKDLHLNLPVLEVLAHASIYNAILDK